MHDGDTWLLPYRLQVPRNPLQLRCSSDNKTHSTGMCRVRNCASTTYRHRGTSSTIALPGTPRAERSGAALPAQKEAAGARAGCLALAKLGSRQTSQLPNAWHPLPSRNQRHGGRHRTTLLGRRWDVGAPSASPASQKAGVEGSCDRGSGPGMNRARCAKHISCSARCIYSLTKIASSSVNVRSKSSSAAAMASGFVRSTPAPLSSSSGGFELPPFSISR